MLARPCQRSPAFMGLTFTSAASQIRYLDDSLQFERHKLEEKEAEFRAQKRILAKEIKTLRSEVLARQAERDSYKEQLKELRQSIAKVGRGTR